MKQVCVIGLGQFGSHLARTLARSGCEVLAIDAAEKAVAAVQDDVQRAVIADSRDFKALESIVSRDVDEAVITVGESLEASILTALHLKRIGVERIRAKAATPDHAEILKAIGVSEIIFPEHETAERMAQRIVHPNLLDFIPLSEEYRVVEVQIPKSFVGKSLAQLGLRKKYNILALAIKTPDKDRTDFLPPADSVLKVGNTLVVIGKGEDVDKFSDET